MHKRLNYLCVYCLLAFVAIAQAEPLATTLFSGDDLSHWKKPTFPDCWLVKDHVLIVKNNKQKKGEVLETQATFTDFILELEFKMVSGRVDSGIMLRNNKDQIQIGESGSLKRDMTGSAYIPGKGYPVDAKGKEHLKPKEWNSLRIKALGPQYTVWLNGKQVLDYRSDTAGKSGPIGIQLHGNRVMEIHYRAITLKVLGDASFKPSTTTKRKGAAVDGQGSLRMTTWAEQPLVVSPVGISMDPDGRMYTTRVRRRKQSSLDLRQHRDWVKHDLSFQSIDDRLAFYKKSLGPNDYEGIAKRPPPDRNKDGVKDWQDLTVQKEEIRVLWDSDGDGRPDKFRVIDDALGSAVTGIAAGVLYHDGHLYAAVEPDIWKYSDSNGDGEFDKREVLATGFSIHIGQGGHNMSGLIVGMDGRLYWSVADKGINATGSDGSHVFLPNRGGVMRCELDGSTLEVFAPGVRNGQELAFDEYGDLFTVDNDGDYPKERERFLYLIEGGQIGWRLNWQWFKMQEFAKVSGNKPYNVWMEEKLYLPHWKGQAAWIVPPIANYSNGPCGFAYNPGTALNTYYRRHFFLNQGKKLTAFQIERLGAAYRMLPDHTIGNGSSSLTGLTFGPDGALYCSDWMNGPSDRGKIYRIDVEQSQLDPSRVNTRELLEQGMTKRSNSDLQSLLSHADMRVRTGAQFELVKRKDGGRLLAAVRQTEQRLARLHGIWGLGQMMRTQPEMAKHVIPWLSDMDAEVRRQAVKVLGDVSCENAGDKLVELLKDPDVRVRVQAAIALGKCPSYSSRKALFLAAEENDDKDVYYRHAIVMGLIAVPEDELRMASSHPSASVRMAALLALRRTRSPVVAVFLKDKDPLIVTEAARAIHDDLSIEEALPALAEALERTDISHEAFLRRAINANFRVGREADAHRLAQYAVRKDTPTYLQTTALACLALWSDPPVLDAVEGRYRILAPRDPGPAGAALAKVADQLSSSSPEVMIVLSRTIERLQTAQLTPLLHAMYDSDKATATLRASLLDAMKALSDIELGAYVKKALADKDNKLRSAAQKYAAYAGLSQIELAQRSLSKGSLEEKRAAIQLLATSSDKMASEILSQLFGEVENNSVDPALSLDVIEAAQGHPVLEEKTREYLKGLEAKGPASLYQSTLFGGSAKKGKALAHGHPAAQCIRCHRINGDGGVLGPDLSNVAGRLDRKKLLASLVDPSADIAKGYGMIVTTLKDGAVHAGTLIATSNSDYVLRMPEGDEVSVSRSQIVSEHISSSMPPMGQILSKQDMRDLVEYLSTLK